MQYEQVILNHLVGTEGTDNIGNTLKGATIQVLGGNNIVGFWNSSVTVDTGDGDDTMRIGILMFQFMVVTANKD